MSVLCKLPVFIELSEYGIDKRSVVHVFSRTEVFRDLNDGGEEALPTEDEFGISTDMDSTPQG